MSVVAKLSLFLATLVVVFVASFALGSAVGPDATSPTPSDAPAGHAEHDAGGR